MDLVFHLLICHIYFLSESETIDSRFQIPTTVLDTREIQRFPIALFVEGLETRIQFETLRMKLRMKLPEFFLET